MLQIPANRTVRFDKKQGCGIGGQKAVSDIRTNKDMRSADDGTSLKLYRQILCRKNDLIRGVNMKAVVSGAPENST